MSSLWVTLACAGVIVAHARHPALTHTWPRCARVACSGVLLSALAARLLVGANPIDMASNVAPLMLGVAVLASLPRVALASWLVLLAACAEQCRALASLVVAAFAACALLVGLVAFGMAQNRWTALRLVMHTSSLAIMLWLAVPWCAQRVALRLPGGERWATTLPSTPALDVFGVMLLIAGTVFAAHAGRTLVAHGGTPDPWDPPLRWCQSGLYAHLQHPMQLGQIVTIVGSTLLWRTGATCVAAGIMVLVLLVLRPIDLAAARARTLGSYLSP